MRPRLSVLARLDCAVLVASFALSFACESRGRVEAAAVMHALDVVRNAPRAGKRGPAQALAALPCTIDEVCATRDRCSAAYLHLAEGTDVENRVRESLDKLEKAPPATADSAGPIPSLTAELDRAESELKGAKAELPGCEEAAARLRQKFGI